MLSEEKFIGLNNKFKAGSLSRRRDSENCKKYVLLSFGPVLTHMKLSAFWTNTEPHEIVCILPQVIGLDLAGLGEHGLCGELWLSSTWIRGFSSGKYFC